MGRCEFGGRLAPCSKARGACRTRAGTCRTRGAASTNRRLQIARPPRLSERPSPSGSRSAVGAATAASACPGRPEWGGAVAPFCGALGAGGGRLSNRNLTVRATSACRARSICASAPPRLARNEAPPIAWARSSGLMPVPGARSGCASAISRMRPIISTRMPPRRGLRMSVSALSARLSSRATMVSGASFMRRPSVGRTIRRDGGGGRGAGSGGERSPDAKRGAVFGRGADARPAGGGSSPGV